MRRKAALARALVAATLVAVAAAAPASAAELVFVAHPDANNANTRSLWTLPASGGTRAEAHEI
ncbi:MAG TPA: hypothetical protein VGW10_04095, partial [Solirubrobacteraceae bacterium]|nr:hypothetical protein [Solirubrobacteraceae bacterium]